MRLGIIYQHLPERQFIQHEVLFLRHAHNITIKSLNRDIVEYLKLSPDGQEKAFRKKAAQKQKAEITKTRMIAIANQKPSRTSA